MESLESKNLKIYDKSSSTDENQSKLATPKKGCKRKNLEDLVETPCSSKKRNSVDPVELSNILEGMEDEIDDVLQKAASRNNLTRTNVKNILRHVITNEYVLSMVRNTMKIENGEDKLEEAVFEPKFTRSKAKELCKMQYPIPWPVSTPLKKADAVTQQLLEQEFPDESSDDEDYKPNEEEEHSEDDTARSRTSDLWSPCTPMSELSPSLAVTKEFEYPDEDENALIIELPDLDLPHETSEADKIALRTRSKLPLNDTPLEEIEASFFDPDFTVDMYDLYDCDDDEWLKFLSDLGKPIDKTPSPEHQADDTEDDPEYHVQEEDDAPDPLDLTFDQTTKVPRNELKSLMAEILEFAEQECLDEDEEEEENKQSDMTIESVFTSPPANNLETKSEWMTITEKLQLDEQMRMYVQLLTQAYLLSHGCEDLQFINISTKLFLDEIKMFSSRETMENKKSVFLAHNLDDALKIINKFEKHCFSPSPQSNESPLKHCPVPTVAKRTMAMSKVFIYPELLPTCGFPPPFQFRKSVFTAAEDNLIALGLEQFSGCDSKITMIQNLLVPTKTISQIKVRIKNCFSSKASSSNNPIKYYQEHKVAPSYNPDIRKFDPEAVKIPAECPLEILPKWMVYYCRVASGNPMFVPPPIAPCQPIAPTVPPVAVVHPMFRKMPEKRKSRPILPHGTVVSPLKQITPILKKYSFPKRASTVLPIAPACPLKEKCGRISNEQCIECSISRLRAIKPKPVNNSDSSDAPIISVPANLPLITDSSFIQPPVNVVSPNSNDSYVTVATPVNLLVTPIAVSNLPNSVLEACSEVKKLNDASSSECAQNPEIYITPDLETSPDINRKVRSPKQPRSKSDETEINSSTADLDVDETIEEDEHDTSVIATVTTKKQTMSKKKNRLHKDLESSLALLKPSMVSNDPKKEEREILYVNSYLLRAAESLKNEPETWNNFLMSICKYQHSTKFPVKLYLDLKVVLKNHPALLDDFVAFLKPAEAKLVGKLKQYFMLNKIREFLRKVEVHFSSQPHHIPRIVRALSQFRQQSYVTSAEALSGLLPLLRNQTHLVEELSQLIPDAAPPVYLLTDFEDVTFPNSDEDVSSNGSCENITIPDTPDPYGGKECPCDCHSSSSDSRMLNRSRHCTKCGVKFIDGRIYLQTGKVLKPAQVTYHELPPDPHNKGKDGQKKSPLPHEIILKVLSEADSASKLESVASKKENPKAVSSNSKSAIPNTSGLLQASSKLPCDVIEDTVFPSSVNSSNKSTPSDFSHLRVMISQSKESSASTQTDSKKILSTVLKRKWNSEEDKLLIYNCQRLGISKETFIVTAKTLKCRTAEEVESRLFNLVEMISETIPKQA